MDPNYMIYKDFCPDCKGFGHSSSCKCKNEVDFIVGCCKRCGGEGFVAVQPEPKQCIYGPYGTEIMIGTRATQPSKKILEA